MTRRTTTVGRIVLAGTGLALVLGLVTACGGDDGDLAGAPSTPAATASSPRATPEAPATTASPPPATTDTPTSRATVPSPTPTAADVTAAITYRGGQVQGGAPRVRVEAGEEVRLAITSDVADEIHVHGYDLHQDVAAGETVMVAFTADIPGVFEIELEERKALLAELEVRG